MVENMIPPDQPQPQMQAPQPQQAPPQSSGSKVFIIVIVIVVIIVMAALLAVFMGSDDNGKNGGDGGNGKNGNGDGQITYITAKEGKTDADKVAEDWDSSAKLQTVRGYEGNPNFINLDNWEWVKDYSLRTIDDETIGDGKCIAWKYEYFPAEGDIFNHLHVIVISNGTIIKYEETLSEGAHTGNLDNWKLDSDEVVDIAKTLNMYNNITSGDDSKKYIYYELCLNVWELLCNNDADYTRIKIEDSSSDVIYYYPQS